MQNFIKVNLKTIKTKTLSRLGKVFCFPSFNPKMLKKSIDKCSTQMYNYLENKEGV